MKSEGRESAGWGFVHGLLCAKMSLKHLSGSGRLARRLPLHCLSEINVGEKSKEKVHPAPLNGMKTAIMKLTFAIKRKNLYTSLLLFSPFVWGSYCLSFIDSALIH